MKWNMAYWQHESELLRTESSLSPQRSEPARGPEANLLGKSTASLQHSCDALSLISPAYPLNGGTAEDAASPSAQHYLSGMKADWGQLSHSCWGFTVCWDWCCQHRYVLNKHSRWSEVTLYVSFVASSFNHINMDTFYSFHTNNRRDIKNCASRGRLEMDYAISAPL